MEDIENLIESLAGEIGPVKQGPHPALIWIKWVGGAAAYVVAALLVSGHRADLAMRLHSPLFLAEIALLVLIVCTTALSASLLAFPDLYQRSGAVALPAAAFALFALTMALSFAADNPPSPPPVHSYQCTLSILLLSLLPMLWAFHTMRKLASTHFRFAGAIVSLYAFGIGALWLRLEEQTDSIVHVLEWHYLPMLGVGILGVLAGRALLKW